MISNLWIIGFGIGALIVVVVVILLVGIIFQTKRIIKLANIALSEVEKIESNTMSIWKLNQTNAYTTTISDGFERLETAITLFFGVFLEQLIFIIFSFSKR